MRLLVMDSKKAPELKEQEKIVKIIDMFYPNAEVDLFGSYARGDAHRSSDIDIAIAIDNGKPNSRFQSRTRGFAKKHSTAQLEEQDAFIENETTHVYDELIAQEFNQKILKIYPIFHNIVKKIDTYPKST